MGRAHARAMGSGGRFKEGVIPSGTRGPAAPCVPEWVWLPLLRKNIKASAFKKSFKDEILIKQSKSN